LLNTLAEKPALQPREKRRYKEAKYATFQASRRGNPTGHVRVADFPISKLIV
jgi:hypothetical protein